MSEAYVPVRVVDGKGHLLGRLAALCAKQILLGHRVVIVRCEGVVISGNFYRNKLKYLDFLRKRTKTNPKKGPLHLRAPSKIVWRTIRGMLPHKRKRGLKALGRLSTYEGVPPRYAKVRRWVAPSCLKVIRLKPQRRFAVLARLSHEVGWKHKALIETLEEKRKAKSQIHWERKQEALKLRAKAVVKAKRKTKRIDQQLESMGYVLN